MTGNPKDSVLTDNEPTMEDLIDLIWHHTSHLQEPEIYDVVDDCMDILAIKGVAALPELRVMLNIPEATRTMAPLSEEEKQKARDRRERARQRMGEEIVAKPAQPNGKVVSGQGALYRGPAGRKPR